MAEATAGKPNKTGKITQVIGAVVDVQFEGNLPAILNSLETDNGFVIKEVRQNNPPCCDPPCCP